VFRGRPSGCAMRRCASVTRSSSLGPREVLPVQAREDLTDDLSGTTRPKCPTRHRRCDSPPAAPCSRSTRASSRAHRTLRIVGRHQHVAGG
jgi:hypothetical protein